MHKINCMMEKKYYKIRIGGESEGYCVRKLTDSEYELVKGILDDCNSEYCSGSIEPASEYYVANIRKINSNICIGYRRYVLTENDFKYDYDHLNYNDEYNTHYICKTQEEAQLKIQYDKLIKNIKIESILKDGVLCGVDFISETKELILRYLNIYGTEEKSVKLNLILTDEEIKEIVENY